MKRETTFRQDILVFLEFFENLGPLVKRVYKARYILNPIVPILNISERIKRELLVVGGPVNPQRYLSGSDRAGGHHVWGHCPVDHIQPVITRLAYVLSLGLKLEEIVECFIVGSVSR